MLDFLKNSWMYIAFFILLIERTVKELTTRKQKKYALKESKFAVQKLELDVSESLKDSLRKTAEEWKQKYQEEKEINKDLVQNNKTLVENIVKVNQEKADYIEEVHKLRIEVQELKNIILKFQAQFPDLFVK